MIENLFSDKFFQASEIFVSLNLEREVFILSKFGVAVVVDVVEAGKPSRKDRENERIEFTSASNSRLRRTQTHHHHHRSTYNEPTATQTATLVAAVVGCKPASQPTSCRA